MIVLTFGVAADFKNHGAKLASTPPNGTELFGKVASTINDIGLVEDLSRLLKADTVLLFDNPALVRVEGDTHL